MKPVRLAVGTLGACAIAAVLAAPTAQAATGTVSAQYQGYGDAAPGGQDPYAGDTPQDVHVDGFGGQPVVNGYIRLNLDSLPSGSTIDGLTLKLIPNGSQTDNVEPAMAAIQACPLTQPLSSSGYQATPPSYDCGNHANGEPQPDGSWNFELAPLASRWAQGQNDGLALVAYPPPTGTPVTQASPSAWSVAFDHTKTTAAVDYTPGSLSSNSFFGGSVAPLPAPASSGGSGVVAAPPINPAPPAASTPAPSKGAAPTPGAVASQPATASPARGGGQWLWIAGTLMGAALLMVVVTAAQQALRGGSLSLLNRTGAALAASRSQLATPVAVLALASVFALGFSGQLVGSAGPGGASSSGAAGGSGAGLGGGAGTGSGSAVGPGGSTTPGGSAPGSSGAGAAAGGGAAAAAAANTNGGLDGPGVTSTAVRLGFIYVSNSQAANNAFGVHVADVGNEQAEEQALVDYMNKHGGIGGRQIQPVYVNYNNAQAETDPTIGEEACKSFTEDYHVFAVIAGAGPPDDSAANACFAQAGTMNFDPSGAVPDLGFLKQASPYIWASEDSALDRTMRWEISGLQSRGFFNSTEKLGVVSAQDAVNERVYQQVTLPGLEAAGVNAKNIDNREVPHDTLSDTANTMKQVVAAYQIEGINNVIFQGGGIDGGGSYALLFMLDAESQHFAPRYGLSSDDAPVALAQNVPQDQLVNALSVGTQPAVDTDDQHYGQWPYTRDQKTCAAIEASVFTTSTQEGALAIIAYCDAMFELQEGAAALVGQPLNAQLWADQAMKLGSNVFDAGLYSRYVGPGHWDAAGGYRLLHAVQNCEGSSACFEYDNSTLYS